MQNNFCWVIQLFSLACTVKGYYDREYLQWEVVVDSKGASHSLFWVSSQLLPVLGWWGGGVQNWKRWAEVKWAGVLGVS